MFNQPYKWPISRVVLIRFLYILRFKPTVEHTDEKRTSDAFILASKAMQRSALCQEASGIMETVVYILRNTGFTLKASFG